MEKPLFVNDISRLTWACRRGMLELDVLLGNFLIKAYPDLVDEDKERFIKLLACSDPELFKWLLGQEMPADPDLRQIVGLIRAEPVMPAKAGI